VRDIRGSLARQSLLVAAVCLAADLGLFLVSGPPLDSGWRVWLVLAGSVAVDVALAGPARMSGWVAAGQAGMLILSSALLPRNPVGNNSGILVAGYRAGAWLATAPASMALAALITGLATGHLLSIGRNSHDWRLIVVNLLSSGLMPWLVGRYTTARRAYLAELQRRAELQRHDEQEAIRQAIAEDRIAIARDLHDVISHHVSAIGLHAGAARLGLPAGPESGAPVRRSLSAVESASRSAMVDLRRLLDLLHGQEAEGGRQPGLDNLDELLDGVRAAGLPATVSTTGEPRPLPGSLDVALYRIAQEALTNALRHGDGSLVELELAYHRDEVTLSVTNGFTPSEREAEFPHRGLAGIRQRVALFGGRVACGPVPGSSNWRVEAAFPRSEETK
jgi:signal transduction histidine kinase